MLAKAAPFAGLLQGTQAHSLARAVLGVIAAALYHA